jgi:hypothetical protein
VKKINGRILSIFRISVGKNNVFEQKHDKNCFSFVGTRVFEIGYHYILKLNTKNQTNNKKQKREKSFLYSQHNNQPPKPHSHE